MKIVVESGMMIIIIHIRLSKMCCYIVYVYILFLIFHTFIKYRSICILNKIYKNKNRK